MTQATIADYIEWQKAQVTSQVDVCKLDGEAGQTAREFLGSLFLRKKEDQIFSELNEWGQSQAAQAFADLPANREIAMQVAGDICGALAHGVDLSLPVRSLLLNAFDAIVPFAPLQMRAETLIKAIELEMERLPLDEQDTHLLALMERVAISPHPDAHPLLAAIADKHKNPKVKELAHRILHDWTASTARIWAETQADFLSSDGTRQGLVTAAASQSDERELVSDLFRAVKDWPATNLNCLFLPDLANLMEHSSDFVKLAAIRALIQKHPGNALLAESNPILLKAINTLCSMSVQTDTPTAAQEAALLLETLNEAPEAIKSLVFEAKTKASEEFVRRLNSP